MAGSVLIIEANQPAQLLKGLHVGFLLTSGSCGETKSYSAFTFDKPSGTYSFARLCTAAEKQHLKRAVYRDRAVRSVRTKLSAGDDCLLFVGR